MVSSASVLAATKLPQTSVGESLQSPPLSCVSHRVSRRNSQQESHLSPLFRSARDGFAGAADERGASVFFRGCMILQIPANLRRSPLIGRVADTGQTTRITHGRLSPTEAPIHLRSPSAMVRVRASAEPQPVPRRPCQAAPSRRSRTRGQEEAATPLPRRECASPQSARWPELE